MKRITLRFSLPAVFLLGVFCGCGEPKLTDDERIRAILTKGHGEWGPPGIDWGFAAVFAPAHDTKWRYVGEGVNVIPMRYTVTEGKIRIEMKSEALPTARKESVEMLKPVTTCILAELPASLEYLYELHCDNKLKLYSADHPVKDLARKVEKYSVVATGYYRAKVAESVKFRREPDSAAPTISCVFPPNGAAGDKTTKSDTLPAGFSMLRVLARTPEKVKIKTWNNYWLYVLVITDAHDGESCDTNYGWLYGEFVKTL